jgi:hypothetical protein
MIHGRIMDHHYLKVIFIIFLTCTIKPMISDIRWSAILKVAICHNENRSSFISSQKVTINNFKEAKEHECIDFTASFLIDIFLTLLFLIMLSKISRKVTKFFLSSQKWFRHDTDNKNGALSKYISFRIFKEFPFLFIHSGLYTCSYMHESCTAGSK